MLHTLELETRVCPSGLTSRHRTIPEWPHSSWQSPLARSKTFTCSLLVAMVRRESPRPMKRISSTSSKYPANYGHGGKNTPKKHKITFSIILEVERQGIYRYTGPSPPPPPLLVRDLAPPWQLGYSHTPYRVHCTIARSESLTYIVIRPPKIFLMILSAILQSLNCLFLIFNSCYFVPLCGMAVMCVTTTHSQGRKKWTMKINSCIIIIIFTILRILRSLVP